MRFSVFGTSVALSFTIRTSYLMRATSPPPSALANRSLASAARDAAFSAILRFLASHEDVHPYQDQIDRMDPLLARYSKPSKRGT